MTDERDERDRSNPKLIESKKLSQYPATNSEAKGDDVLMHDLLGVKLRAYYDQVANEPVPDRFEQLLKQLDAKSREKKPG